MSNFLQLHLLTSYPPANLNRDDLGRPKTAIIGGSERLRISSQSLKRAWRSSTVFTEHLGENLGVRTKRVGQKAFDTLVEKGLSQAKAKEKALQLAKCFGAVGDSEEEEDSDNETGGGELRNKQLFFFSPEETRVVDALTEKLGSGEELDDSDICAAISAASPTASDIALFGRMLALKDLGVGKNIEAACQVAHAFSVQPVVVEDDYFTAVDDLNSDQSGAAHIGVVEFGSGLFYLYICVNKDLLTKNLKGDAPLVRKTLTALVEASATIAPTGKQNSFGSRAWASYILAERSAKQPRSLSVAFLDPIRSASGMLEEAVSRLRKQRDSFDSCYFDAGSFERYELCVSEGAGKLSDLVEFMAR